MSHPTKGSITPKQHRLDTKYQCLCFLETLLTQSAGKKGMAQMEARVPGPCSPRTTLWTQPTFSIFIRMIKTINGCPRGDPAGGGGESELFLHPAQAWVSTVVWHGGCKVPEIGSWNWGAFWCISVQSAPLTFILHSTSFRITAGRLILFSVHRVTSLLHLTTSYLTYQQHFCLVLPLLCSSTTLKAHL